jgi:1-acyl-sn-glycerol-3-phosphate acyltransferase
MVRITSLSGCQARIGFAWRWIATGLVFLSFGICGTAFSLFLLPIALAFPNRTMARRVVMTVIHRYFRALVAWLQLIGVMRLEVDGEVDSIAKGSIIVANHPTYLDVMILLALIPSACCVVKRAHWRNPCFLGIVRAAGYVSNADPTSFVEESRRRLREGFSLIVFPEGTRSPAGGDLHRFSRGFAHVALSDVAGEPDEASIVPVLLGCDPPVFTKNQRWYHVPPRAFRFRVAVLDALDTHAIEGVAAASPVAVRSLATTIQNHISQQLFKHGFAQART